WRLEHPHDTPPYPLMPSPTFVHNSPSGWIEDFHLQAVVQYSAHQRKAPLDAGLEARRRGLAYPASLGRLVTAEARSNRRPRLSSHLFGLNQLCGLLRERKVCTSDIWRSRRSSS